MKKGSVTLYNMIFPTWMLLLVPVVWIIVIPANFVIDSIVVLITLMIQKQTKIFKIYASSILKIWVFGFAADIIGSIFLYAIYYILEKIPNRSVSSFLSELSYTPFDNISALIIVLIAIALSGYLIFLFNYKISFKKLDIQASQKKYLALSLAIFTAPYTFLIQSNWF